MDRPNLKRITIAAERDLRNWLSKFDGPEQTVMLITPCQSSRKGGLSQDQVQAALSDHGWKPGRRYTLNANLLGHVIHRRQR